MQCIYCKQEMLPERAAIRPYCMEDQCVALGLSGKMSNLALVLVPKQGFAYVYKDQVADNTRSSGR